MQDILFIVASLVVLVSTERCGSEHPEYPCFEIIGNDFENTQFTKICLLAQINASITLTYNGGSSPITTELFIPENAVTHGSFCDHLFTSLLMLTFEDIELKFFFTRDIVHPSETDITYCNDCDSGNWVLKNITMYFLNTTTIQPTSPTSALNTTSAKLPNEAGALLSGISLRRSYSCEEKDLVIDFHVPEGENWQSRMRIYQIKVQPFLVKEPIFNDPFLCSDVVIFHVFIIMVPILYFAIFIIYYRVKERYGFPPDLKKPKMKPLIEESSIKQKIISESSGHEVVVTCTSPENTETCIL